MKRHLNIALGVILGASFLGLTVARGIMFITLFIILAAAIAAIAVLNRDTLSRY